MTTFKERRKSKREEMYHHHHHQSKNNLLASRTSFPPDRHLFLQGANAPVDTGLVLSTDAKPRLKWTTELHKHFIDAVDQLGGADKATPKTVMKLMGIPGLTLYHLKSHLQKYRLSKNLQAQANNGTSKNGCTVAGEKVPEVCGSLMSSTNSSQTNKSLQISEALHMQIEVQRSLHEQLEVQRHLQLRIEAQGKYLQSVLEKAQETLGRQNLGSAGLEAAKEQLSELVSKVSAFPGLKEVHLHSLQTQNQLADCTMDNCLTLCEGSQKDQEIHNISIGLTTYQDDSLLCPNQIGENTRLDQIRPAWEEALNEDKMFPSSIAKNSEMTIFPVQSDSGDLSISIRVQGDKGSGSTISVARRRDRDTQDPYLENPNSKRTAIQQERGKQSSGFGMPSVTAQLDLNAHDDSDASPSFKQFDLNGFSWS